MFQWAELRILWSLGLHVKREELEERTSGYSGAAEKGLAGWCEDRKEQYCKVGAQQVC